MYVVGGLDAYCKGGLFGEVLAPWQAGLLGNEGGWWYRAMRATDQRIVRKWASSPDARTKCCIVRGGAQLVGATPHLSHV